MCRLLPLTIYQSRAPRAIRASALPLTRARQRHSFHCTVIVALVANRLSESLANSRPHTCRPVCLEGIV